MAVPQGLVGYVLWYLATQPRREQMPAMSQPLVRICGPSFCDVSCATSGLLLLLWSVLAKVEYIFSYFSTRLKHIYNFILNARKSQQVIGHFF